MKQGLKEMRTSLLGKLVSEGKAEFGGFPTT